ncbi:hypothetical protein LOCC1_G005334 [Lachnellula occidentalis]|uniref:Lysine-specific metallo-endopeptidase domain-containing protein n=1 Tax=Lachnellula occidentalis TaxID=215460 RepID=A0A8H8RTW6_9HELO|nr:hypothetical protein LOCC1_G005334 [Lachnellula occidentalis]
MQPLAPSTCSQSLFGVAIFLFLFVLPTLAAEFNAKEFFLYFDESCNKLEDTVNEAGDDMNALVQAALNSFSWTPLSVKTFAAYWGKITDDLATNSGLVHNQYRSLGKAMSTKKYSLYCGPSAFSFVTVKQEGGDKGKPWDDGKGRWYIAADRRAANIDSPYILGSKRPDYCTTETNKVIGAASVPGKPYIILCPASFSTGGIVKYTSLLGVKDTVQPDGTNLDAMESTGSVMLHEFTHAILSTNALASQPEIYGQLFGRLNAKKNPARVRKNADTFSNYGKACLLEQNAWVTGKAEDKTKYDASGMVRLHRRRLLDRPLYARGPDSSTNLAIGTKTSIFDDSSPLSSTASGLNSTGSVRSTKSSSSSKSSKWISNLTVTPLNSTRSSTSPSSSSSVVIPGSGILPFPTTTNSSSPSSATSTPPYTWSGSWSDTTTPTPVDFTFFNIPTAVMSDQAASSQAVLLGGLFFALQTNRKRLTDPKLKSQYVDDIKRTKDETQALFNDLGSKTDMPGCSATKRKGKRNALSERQLRALLRDRSIIGSVGSAITGAVNDVSKLISCGLNVVNNLVDTVERDAPDINLVENLTDTLAEIAEDLEEEDKQQSSTERSSSSIPTSKSGSSSSSSSCTSSTVIPKCTETVSFSTSLISGTSVTTIGTITKTTCLTTTMAGCTGSGTTSTTTANSSSDAGNDGTVAIFYFPTDAPGETSLPPESVSWLATAFLDEYTESVSYNGTTAGSATSTAASSAVSTSNATSTSKFSSRSSAAPSPSSTSSRITKSTLSMSTSPATAVRSSTTAPAPASSSSSSTLAAYHTGVCSMHITETASPNPSTVEITASIKDGGGTFLASTGGQTPKWGDQAIIYSTSTGLPYDVTLTFSKESTKKKRTSLSLWRRMVAPGTQAPDDSLAYEKRIVIIQTGDTTFNSTQKDKTKMPWVSVGGWDESAATPNRQLDAYWNC